MDIRKIKKMIELLEESGIAEIEIKEGEETLRIARAMPNQMPVYAHMPMPAVAVTQGPVQQVSAPAVAAPGRCGQASANTSSRHRW